jgi:hypothetical protein
MKYNKQNRIKRQTKFTFFETIPPYGENDLKKITNIFTIYSARLRRRIEIRTPDLYWYETDEPQGWGVVIQKAEDVFWWFFGKFITVIYWSINISIIFLFLFLLGKAQPD